MESYLDVQHLTKSFGEKVLFDDMSFSVSEGQKVGLVARNGTGKSTLLSILHGDEGYDAGQIVYRNDIRVGYLEQTPHFNPTDTVLDACFNHEGNPEKVLRAKQVLTQLRIEDLEQKVGELSGGQLKRVALANVLLLEPDFLILDEPTNHLDIVSKEILENALKDYTGTVLYVSHDRYFINQTATRILELTGQTLVNYIGNYDYYLEKKEELTRIYAPAADAAAPEEAAAPSEASSTKLDWKAQKEEQARLRKKENELKKTEKRIEELETRDSEIDEEMSKPEVATNVAECVKLSKEKAEIAAELEELYEKWEELAE